MDATCRSLARISRSRPRRLRPVAARWRSRWLVTEDEAERLALAVQRGKIQLALRNPLDTEEYETEAVYSEDLGIKDKIKSPVRPAGAIDIPKYTPPPPQVPDCERQTKRSERGQSGCESIPR